MKNRNAESLPGSCPRGLTLGLLLLGVGSVAPRAVAQAPDLRSVEADLVVPELHDGELAAGLRVRQRLPDEPGDVHHTLFLPRDWMAVARDPEGSAVREGADGSGGGDRPASTPVVSGRQRPDRADPVVPLAQASTASPASRALPLIVEFPGNGPYENGFGDRCTGEVEGCRLGYGISGGVGFLWLCLPFVNAAATANVRWWWGDPDAFDPAPTVDYCKRAVAFVCERYGADPRRVLLCGFSRGAIACNFIGLHDDEIAALWTAFAPCSHYDGVVETWGYPGADRRAALARLARLGGRPQFVCHESHPSARHDLAATRAYLLSSGVEGRWTFVETGFRNHDDAWILRPSAARTRLRAWAAEVLRVEEDED